MNKFENEYRDLIQEDMPDLWGRIETGLVEKKLVVQVAHVSEDIKQEAVTQQVIKEVSHKKTNIYKFVKYAGVAVAACLLFVLVMPTAIGMLATGGASESAKSAQNDMAAAEAPEAAAPTAKEPEYNGTWAEDGALMEGAAMEAAPMEEAAKEAYEDSLAMTEGALEAESAETTVEKVILLENGTIIEDIVINITEVEELNYHTIYHASVESDASGTFQTGDIVEFIVMDNVANKAEDSAISGANKENGSEAEVVEEMIVGENYTVTLTYDADAEVSLRLVR